MPSAKSSVLKQFEHIQKGTEYILQAVPLDKLDHSVEKSSATIGGLAFHVATLPLGATLFAQGKFEKFPSTDVLMETLEGYLGDSMRNKDYKSMFTKSCNIFLEYFENKTEDEWINSTYVTPVARGPRTYLEGFLSMQNHLIQHRGSLTSTLRSIGVLVSLRQYWGMTPLSE